MMFPHEKEICEVLLDYPSIGGEDVKYYVKNSISNLLHANIDVHSIRLFSKFPGDGVKYISKLHLNCENMNFADKSRYGRLFQKVTHKVGVSAMNQYPLQSQIYFLTFI